MILQHTQSPRAICEFIYPHAHCLSHCGYTQLLYLFIAFFTSVLGLLATYFFFKEDPTTPIRFRFT